jgi:hypothetical protein
LAPHHDAETTRIRLFAPSWMGNPSFSRVEQIHILLVFVLVSLPGDGIGVGAWSNGGIDLVRGNSLACGYRFCRGRRRSPVVRSSTIRHGARAQNHNKNDDEPHGSPPAITFGRQSIFRER